MGEEREKRMRYNNSPQNPSTIIHMMRGLESHACNEASKKRGKPM